MKTRQKSSQDIKKMMTSLEILNQELDKIPNPEAIGLVIKSIRETLGYSQNKLGAILDLDSTTIWRWENGKTKPTLTYDQAITLNHLLKKIDLSLTDIPYISIVLDSSELKKIKGF